MDGQLSEEVKEARNQDLLAVVNAHAQAKHAALVGQRVEILCEGPSKTNPLRLSGRTPGNKIVVFEGHPRQVGQIFGVQRGSLQRLHAVRRMRRGRRASPAVVAGRSPCDRLRLNLSPL